MEQFIHEKELKRASKGRGSHLINIDGENGEIFEENETMAVEILLGKSYSCPALKPSKGKGIGGNGKFEYDFDISKLD
ncbi:hypothetical protein JHK86_022707 [Glycine max]|nr:hypothetical protein JHK86_022707 [Glycine max]